MLGVIAPVAVSDQEEIVREAADSASKAKPEPHAFACLAEAQALGLDHLRGL